MKKSILKIGTILIIVSMIMLASALLVTARSKDDNSCVEVDDHTWGGEQAKSTDDHTWAGEQGRTLDIDFKGGSGDPWDVDGEDPWDVD